MHLKTFFEHVKSHRILANFRFRCGIQECPGNFRSFSALKSHIHRNHLQKPRRSTAAPSGNGRCNVQGCDYVSVNITTVCAHLRLHIRNGKSVTCPYDGCTNKFRVMSSFTAHVSRKHRQPELRQFNQIESEVIVPAALVSEEQDNTPVESDADTGNDPEIF